MPIQAFFNRVTATLGGQCDWAPFIGRMLSFMCLGLLYVPAQAQERYAFLVGINDYPSPINPLQGCVNDMQNLRTELTDRQGFPRGNVTLVVNRDATRNRILSEIDQFSRKVRSGDVFVFGYSGHGTLFSDEKSEEQDERVLLKPLQLPAGKYDSALVPYDARQKSSGKPWKNLILDDELYAHFKPFTEKGCLVIVVSDSCHSGSLARNADKRIKAISPEMALGVPLTQIEAPAKTNRVDSRRMNGLYLALTSSTDEQVSIEWRNDADEDCGLFLYAFLRALRSGKKTYREVFDTAKADVWQLSQRGQSPQIDGRFFGGSLDSAVFSPPVKRAPGTLRVVVRVVDAEDHPLEKCAFILFQQGKPHRADDKILDTDALLMGRTDARGLFSSADKGGYVLPGEYQVKVVCAGYQPFWSTERISGNADDAAVMLFKLKRE